MKNILLTGGVGYIGSHICAKLFDFGFNPIIVDTFENSSPLIYYNINVAANQIIEPKIYVGDVSNEALLQTIFTNEDIHAVIHLSGYKFVGESVKDPLKYYDNNLTTTISLLNVMKRFNCYNLIFSSSCTVYGNATDIPVTENMPFAPESPYGKTKAMQEEIFSDLCKSDSKWNITSLRYFNPIGSHPSGLLGDFSKKIPNTLMAYLVDTITGRINDKLTIFGNDYDTKDGTCVRDFIHIEDLAEAHIKALLKFGGHKVYNIGTGVGVSVLELIKTFEEATGKKVDYNFADRRSGDVEAIYCDPSLAMKELEWKPTHTLEDACKTALKFGQYVYDNRYILSS